MPRSEKVVEGAESLLNIDMSSVGVSDGEVSADDLRSRAAINFPKGSFSAVCVTALKPGLSSSMRG